jgi:hypothetical protein
MFGGRRRIYVFLCNNCSIHDLVLIYTPVSENVLFCLFCSIQ